MRYLILILLVLMIGCGTEVDYITHGECGNDGIGCVFLRQHVSKNTAEEVIHNLKMQETHPLVSEIHLIITTGGGETLVGREIIKTIKNLNKPIFCIVDKQAVSMGAIIASFCPYSYIQKDGYILHHMPRDHETKVKYDIFGDIPSSLKYLQDMYYDLWEMSGLEFKDFRDKLWDGWRIYDEEAVKYNFIDEIIEGS